MTANTVPMSENNGSSRLRSLLQLRLGGMSLPVYLLVSALILYAAVREILPANMVGALAIMMVLGSLFNLIGSKTPIIRSYLGGGAVFCIFASSALATFGLLPESVSENCTSFMNEVGFLDFYIAALICGSILGMDRELLKKAAIRFLPVSFLSMTVAAIMAGIVGQLTGQGFRESILYIAMPMMSGGMGAGLLIAMAFFTLGNLISNVFPGVHAYAFMIILVLLCKVFGLVPTHYADCAVQWSQFVTKNLTNALLAGIGIAMLNLKTLAAALSPVYLLICLSIVLTVALCAGLLGKLVGFFPVESAITAGLCTNSMGGTGNIAVLSAADRMTLIPFAQMATRLGGAAVLIISGFLIKIL